ncbi:MAG: TIGR04076 family protein [Chloroflexi bacterium]|nr:TIGR04076 family protein [Chloroflexota bacterium]
MRMLEGTKGAWFLAVVFGAGVVVVLLLAQGRGRADLPVGSLIAIASIFAVIAVFAFATEVRGYGSGVRAGMAPAGLKLVTDIGPLSAPVAAVAVEAREGCPHGYAVGDVWTVDRAGHLSQGLCGSALATLEPSFRRVAASQKDERVGFCQCPLGGQRLRFVVRSAA